MSTEHRPSHVAGIVSGLQTIILFFMGILGNKIAESLNIPSKRVTLYAISGMAVLTAISYFQGGGQVAIESAPEERRWKDSIPTTMIGVFPLGILAGVIVGAIVPSILVNPSFIQVPMRWLASLFGYETISMRVYELVGILFGVGVCFIFAILIDNRLAASFFLAYGIAFPTAVLISDPEPHVILITYVAYPVCFGFGAIVFVILEGPFRQVRLMVTEQRL